MKYISDVYLYNCVSLNFYVLLLIFNSINTKTDTYYIHAYIANYKFANNDFMSEVPTIFTFTTHSVRGTIKTQKGV